MHYLIDGYNLLFSLQTHVDPLEQSRENLISALSREIERAHVNATIIFDSSMEHGSAFPSKKQLSNIEVVYSPKDQSADEYMIEWLRWEKSPQSFCLVTSDRGLSMNAKELGAKTCTLKGFLHTLRKRREKRSVEDHKEPIQETDQEIARLLKIFEASDEE